MIYILVKQDGSHSYRDWGIVGLFENYDDALLMGYRIMVNSAIKPWNIQFYKKRNAEFKNGIALPELFIEQWKINDTERQQIWYLGYQPKPFIHYVDKHLKQAEVDHQNEIMSCKDQLDKRVAHPSSENIIKSWKDQLDKGIVPDILKLLVASD